MPLRRALAGVEPYRPQRPMREIQAELGLDRIVKLSSNEGAFGPLPAAVAAFEAAAAELNRYPDGGGLRLRAELAKLHDVPVEQVVLGNGADELIRLCAMAALDPGDRGVLPWPSFPSYGTSIACCGGEAVRVRLSGRAIDFDALLAAVAGGRTKVVYVANPNNPTGAALDAAELREFLDLLPDEVLCVIDEAYAEYADVAPEGIGLVRQGSPGLRCCARSPSSTGWRRCAWATGSRRRGGGAHWTVGGPSSTSTSRLRRPRWRHCTSTTRWGAGSSTLAAAAG